MNAIAEIRTSITEFIQKKHSANTDFNFFEGANEKRIKNIKNVNKPTIQGMASHFPISNDQINENEVTESESISSEISTSRPSNTSVHETSSNCQPLFRCNDFVKKRYYEVCN